MHPVVEALSLFRHHPQLRPYVWRPVLQAIPLFLLLAGGSVWLLGPIVGSWIAFAGLAWAGPLIVAALWILLAGPVFLTLAITLSANAWDRLSREVERIRFGVTTEGQGGALFADGIVRTVFAFLMLAVGGCLGIAVPVIGPLLVASLVAAMDTTAPALVRRGYRFRTQLGALRKVRGIIPFALLCGVVSLFPFVNLLALPVLVTAGTLLVARSRIGELPERA